MAACELPSARAPALAMGRHSHRRLGERPLLVALDLASGCQDALAQRGSSVLREVGNYLPIVTRRRSFSRCNLRLLIQSSILREKISMRTTIEVGRVMV